MFAGFEKKIERMFDSRAPMIDYIESQFDLAAFTQDFATPNPANFDRWLALTGQSAIIQQDRFCVRQIRGRKSAGLDIAKNWVPRDGDKIERACFDLNRGLPVLPLRPNSGSRPLPGEDETKLVFICDLTMIPRTIGSDLENNEWLNFISSRITKNWSRI
jgi:hypothetical protein